MNLKSIFLAACILGGATQASATVTLYLSDALGGVFAKGFAGQNGVAKDGMRWGIVVDTTGNGFQAGNYDPFTLTSGAGSFLNASSAATDDYFFASSSGGDFFTTFDSSGFDAVNGGAGTITSIVDVPFGGATGIGATDKIALIWFDTNSAADGSKYGFLSGPTFALPGGIADGGDADLSGLVPAGSRTASFTFGGATVVPEPSRLMLLGLGFFGLFFRRRR